MDSQPSRKEVAVLALSRDDIFVASLESALQDSRRLLHAESLADAESQLIMHPIGVVVTDRGTAHDDIELIASRLRPISPELVIVVAGDRSHANDLMELITSGDIYRFLLTPLAPGQTRVCIESAVNRFLSTPNDAAPPAEKQPDEPSRNLVPLLAAGATALVLVAGAAFFFSAGPDKPVEAAADSAGSVAAPEASLPDARPPEALPGDTRDAAVNRALSAARQALADKRYVEPNGANALYYYRSVLAEQPDNVEAQLGLDDIVTALLKSADAALESANPAEARLLLNAGQSIQPEHPGLADALVRLASQETEAGISAANEAAVALDFDAALSALDALPASDTVTAAQNRILAEQQQHTLEVSLQRLAAQVAADALIEPADDSAHFHAMTASAVAPDDPRVMQALAGLGDLLLDRAALATSEGRLNEADTLLDAASALAVDTVQIESARQVNADAMAVALASQAQADANSESLSLAVERLNNDQLLAPAEDSAYFHLSQVQGPDRDNAEFTQTAQRLATALLLQASESVAAGNLDAAEQHLDAADELGADAAVVAAQRGAIANAIQSRNAIQAVNAGYISTQELVRTQYEAPDYPGVARRRNLEGAVLLEFTVTRTGNIADIQVIESRPGRIFERSAIAALSQWAYEPYVIDGQLLEPRVRVEMQFVLN